MVSAYSPRRCAAAAFAKDLGRALSPEFDLVVCALDRYGLSYPPEVAAVIREDEHDDYRRAARVLAEYEVDAVLVQYDATSFGGPLALDLAHELRRLELPYVVALHGEPGTDTDQDRITAALAAGAHRTLVFTEPARRGLSSQLGLDPATVEVVPIGVPAPEAHHRTSDHIRPGWPVLTWIGPLTQERGFETALAALPAIRSEHPGVRLVAAGRPVTDAHRERVRDAAELVEAHLGPLELAALLRRTDIVVAPMPAAGRSWSAMLTAVVAAGVRSSRLDTHTPRSSSPAVAGWSWSPEMPMRAPRPFSTCSSRCAWRRREPAPSPAVATSSGRR
jgi:glycosyltransferase involved in cell wall biosynthesis